MDDLTLGILVLTAFMSITGLMMVFALRRYQASGASRPLIQVLIPYVVVEGIFVLVFILWFLNL